MKTTIEKNLLRRNDVWRPFIHKNLIVSGDGGEILGIPGPIYSEFKSGPNLAILANCMANFFGAGFYGIASIEYVGTVDSLADFGKFG